MTRITAQFPLDAGRTDRGGHIAFIEAGWHREIVGRAYQGFVGETAAPGLSERRIDRFDVPGAFEIPLHAQMLARTGRYDAIVAVAFVVDGGVYRHEFVAETVVGALMQVQLATGVPVFSVVLTPHHFHEHDTHGNFFRDHFVAKGAEAARACAQTLESLSRLAGVA